MAVFIGTSGWSYDHWVGILYPKSAKSLERLDAYARNFRTVEVNNTFYRWPKEDVFSTWRKRSPDGFVFSAKAVVTAPEPAFPDGAGFSGDAERGPRQFGYY